jgi:thymidylate synthase
MKQYLDLVRHVMENGEDRIDRTGVGTRSVFGYQTRYNLQDGFPLVTTKFTSLKTIIKELVWYLRGDGNVKFLQDNGVTIWNEWADSNGDLGKVYPHQWMNWEKYEVVNYSDHLSLDDTTTIFYNAKVKVSKINQFEVLIDGLKNNPASRRHIVSAWNVSDLDKMALPPCHAFFQFHVSTSGKLSCHLTQRSMDTPLGCPYNIACYSLLTHILAKICGYEVGEFIHTVSDMHVYHNQFDGVEELLKREPYPLPKLIMPENLTDLNQLINGEITWDDFKLEGYQYHPRIDFPVAV